MQPDVTRKDLIRAVILILISGLGIGMLPNMTKLSLLAGGDSASVLFARTLFGLCALGAYVKFTGGSLRISKEASPDFARRGISHGDPNLCRRRCHQLHRH